jgi:hypothetical protein
MMVWREAALRLEQENAKLRDLNNVHARAALTFITGTVMADSGSPFRQSVLLNVGGATGIIDGWPTMDGLGLVGRISGVGDDEPGDPPHRHLLAHPRHGGALGPEGDPDGGQQLLPLLDFSRTATRSRRATGW